MDEKIFRQKVMGCWLGKAVGGTLGQPYEGCDGPCNLDFYDPVPTDMVPNDDLDLQVLWCCVLAKEDNPVVDRKLFSGAWLKHVGFPWDEYGIAIRNLRMGIPAPYSGIYDNFFKDGLGAAIRSELWACFAPGDPALAAKYAYEDACVDHYGDGLYAAQFWAAAESCAFVERDLNRIIDAGLSVIPADCRMAEAVTAVRKKCADTFDFITVREYILENFESESFTDVVMNGAFAVMSLLLGNGDFGKTICLSANCGRDADCSTATVGALLGVRDPDCIGEKWLKPIGRKLILNATITGITPPETLDEFTDMVIGLKKKVSLRPADAPEEKEPDWEKFAITADCGLFGPFFRQDDIRFVPVLPEKTVKKKFSGTFGSLSAGEIPPDKMMMMRFKFEMPSSRAVRVMFNTYANCRVYVDGQYAFGRECGRMAPSFHRCPLNQYKDMELSGGIHEISVAIQPQYHQEIIRWMIGVGDLQSKQWLYNIWR